MSIVVLLTISSIHWSGFTSSTTDIKTAKFFAGNSKVIFEIEIKNGKDIQNYSMFKKEKEILLSPNIHFIVKEHRKENGYLYVCLQEIELDQSLEF